MFSVDNFYVMLYENLLNQADVDLHYFYPYGSTKSENLVNYPINATEYTSYLLAHDQEPILNDIKELPNRHPTFFTKFKLLGNSEHSDLKNKICKENDWEDFYYFFHGFASLYWFNDWKYLENLEKKITHPFISLNRLVTNDRSYRLLLISKMLEKDLVHKGLVSLSLLDHGFGTWQNELTDSNSKLSESHKKFIHKQLGKIDYKSLVLDNDNPQGLLSASSGIKDFELQQKALWNIVNETVFYYNKLHLTEKIFKPITCRRPFILVAAPGNLAYLKSYGFQTFNSWIDESYDQEVEFDKRLDKIVNEIKKISELNYKELKEMHQEMQSVLKYNFNHFYGNFKHIIVKEMLDNFKVAIESHNSKAKNFKVNINKIDFNLAYKMFMR